MEFQAPVKLPDGRYFAKVVGNESLSIMNVVVNDPASDDITLKIKNADKILEYDAKCIEAAVANSESWFSKKITEDVIQTYYQSSYDSDTQELEVQSVLNKNGKPAVAFFSESKELIEGIESGTNCNVLVQLDGLWFLRKTFGPVWRLVQARVRRVAEPVKCLIQDEDE